jgi:hypothetical protein
LGLFGPFWHVLTDPSKFVPFNKHLKLHNGAIVREEDPDAERVPTYRKRTRTSQIARHKAANRAEALAEEEEFQALTAEGGSPRKRVSCPLLALFGPNILTVGRLALVLLWLTLFVRGIAVGRTLPPRSTTWRLRGSPRAAVPRASSLLRSRCWRSSVLPWIRRFEVFWLVVDQSGAVECGLGFLLFMIPLGRLFRSPMHSNVTFLSFSMPLWTIMAQSEVRSICQLRSSNLS